MTKEIWKDIPGFPGFQASSLGRIKGVARCVRNKHGFRPIQEKIRIPRIHKGYYSIKLTRIAKPRNVHQLVAWAFLGKPGKMVVNHKNGIKTDNRPENLEYITNSENLKYSWETGLISRKLTHKQTDEIINSQLSSRKIAKLYGVSDSYIRSLRNGTKTRKTRILSK